METNFRRLKVRDPQGRRREVNNEKVHQGETQEVLMWTLVTPRTALERQVHESVSKDRLSTNPKSCLNLKSEWGQSQTPFLQAKPNKPSRKPKEKWRKMKRPARESQEGKEEPSGRRHRMKGPEDNRE